MIRLVTGIIEQNGLILIARRSLGKHLEGYWEFNAGRWEFPKGKIEFDTPENGLKRVLLEEFNIITELKRGLNTINHRYPDESRPLFCFTAKIISGEIITLKDYAEYEWIKIEDIYNFEPTETDIELHKDYHNSIKKGVTKRSDFEF